MARRNRAPAGGVPRSACRPPRPRRSARWCRRYPRAVASWSWPFGQGAVLLCQSRLRCDGRILLCLPPSLARRAIQVGFTVGAVNLLFGQMTSSNDRAVDVILGDQGNRRDNRRDLTSAVIDQLSIAKHLG